MCILRYPPTVVALTGLADSGKDTVADTLVRCRDFVKLAFADALREEVAQAFQVEPTTFTERTTKEHSISILAVDRCLDDGFVKCMRKFFKVSGLSEELLSVPRSPRQIMQWWGTEYRRAQSERYWTDQLLARMVKLVQAGEKHFVIADCRFGTEAALVRSLQGHIWQVVRPDAEPVASTHISETQGAQFLPDELIDNTHDLYHLQTQALAACNRLLLSTTD